MLLPLPRLAGGLPAAALAAVIAALPGFALPAPAPPAPALPAPVTVLSWDQQGNAHVDLHLLAPLTPQLRAVLAVYAFSANTGCEGPEEGEPMRCALTTALGLGEQCSSAQLELIRRWFKRGLPAFGGDAAESADVLKRYGYRFACYAIPAGASHQLHWDALQVELAGELATVRASGTWLNTTERAGDYRTVTVFRLLADRVDVVTDESSAGETLAGGEPVASGCKVEPVLPETGPRRARFLDWLRAHPGQAGAGAEPERAELLLADVDNDQVDEYVLATPRGAAGGVALEVFRAAGTGWTRTEPPPFGPLVRPYRDPLSGQSPALVRFCGHVYVNLRGGEGAGVFPDTHALEDMEWRPVCAAPWLAERRREFQRLFDLHRYGEAHAFLDGVARACRPQAKPRTWLWMQSDLALAAVRMGDPATCLEHVAAAEQSPDLPRAGPTLRKAVAANAALCRGASAGRPSRRPPG